MKLLTFVVAASFVLGSASAARAQADAAPPPPPPPAAPPADAAAPPAAPPAATGAPVGVPVAGAIPGQPGAPAAQPAAPPAPPPPSPPPPAPIMAPPPSQPMQPPPMQWQPSLGSTPPQADSVTADADKTPGNLAWRGTTFTWNHSATTTLIGIGRDNIGSEEEVYSWAFVLKPNLYLVDLPKDKLTASVEIGWQTELTDGSTVQKRETLFQDLTVGARYSRTLFEGGGADNNEYRTTIALGGRLRFPTSKFSTNQGKYLTTFLGPSLTQQIKILGSTASGLNNITAGISANWGHLFSRSDTPTNPDLNRTRQSATGQTILSDQLSSGSFARNTLATTLTIGLPLYHELALSTAFGLLANFKHEFKGDGCDVYIANQGCITAGSDPTKTLYQPTTSFDVSLSYPILQVAAITVGYQNIARQIGENGQRRNMFYSPDAQFYVDLTANIDGIYSTVTGRGAEKAAQKQTASR